MSAGVAPRAQHDLVRDLVRQVHAALTERGISARARRNWTAANDLFHDTVLIAAGNARLATIVSELHRSFPRSLTWGALQDEPSLLLENVLQHERVRVAISRRDADDLDDTEGGADDDAI